jgi:excisionase family DNA binding protein
MTTFTYTTTPEHLRDAEMALSALLPLMARRGKLVHMQLKGSQKTIALPREALAVVVEVLRQMTQGNASALVPLDQELTTQQAAEMLNVSRPYLVGLLDSGAIPSRKVGKHRRVRMADIVVFKQTEELTRKARLDELTQEAQRLGLGY